MSTQRKAPLDMRKEEFRQVGYYLIDAISGFIDSIGDHPVTRAGKPNELQALIGSASLPQSGIHLDTLVKRTVNLLFTHSLLNGHPRFMGYITSSAAPIGALADLLSAAINSNVGANILSPIATAIERQTIQWLAEFIGISPRSGGIVVSGGNMANFTAFLAARTAKTGKTIHDLHDCGDPKLVVYCSAATHAWIEKAVFFFGVGSTVFVGLIRMHPAGLEWIYWSRRS